MSPELLDPDRFGFGSGRPTRGSDCYALGMVILEVLSGQPPFPSDSVWVVMGKVTKGKHPGRPRGSERVWFTDDLWEMLKQCWSPQPKDRPNVQAVLGCLERVSTALRPLPAGACDDIKLDSGDELLFTVSYPYMFFYFILNPALPRWEGAKGVSSTSGSRPKNKKKTLSSHINFGPFTRLVASAKEEGRIIRGKGRVDSFPAPQKNPGDSERVLIETAGKPAGALPPFKPVSAGFPANVSEAEEHKDIEYASVVGDDRDSVPPRDLVITSTRESDKHNLPIPRVPKIVGQDDSGARQQNDMEEDRGPATSVNKPLPNVPGVVGETAERGHEPIVSIRAFTL